jgi:D-glycero-beta-D-manno-heptose 1-phosphate adenylyltransferase
VSIDKLVKPEELESLGDRLRRQGRTVVWTSGCFDVLHLGHVRSMQAARAHGDTLVVGLNSDASVRKLKGPTRPIFPAEQRAEMVAALACVDHVVVFDESTPEASLSRLRPAVHCKGADYAPGSGKAIPEAALVESYGGRVVFLPLIEGLSTTGLLERIREMT